MSVYSFYEYIHQFYIEITARLNFVKNSKLGKKIIVTPTLEFKTRGSQHRVQKKIGLETPNLEGDANAVQG